MTITIVIPAYNEERSIEVILKSIMDYMAQKKDVAYDIIVVDDGSSDNTVKLIEDMRNKYAQISLIQLGSNFGKGKAVREGMLKGEGAYLLFMDADSSTSIKELEKFFPLINKNKDVIIGTRKVCGAQILKHQSFYREFFGKGFTWLSNFITKANVSDFTCGFKCFSQKSARQIFSRSVIDDWAFDAEILYLAKKMNFEIIEVPIVWKNDKSSKVRLFRDILNSLKGLFRIHIYSKKGYYA